MDDLFVLSVVVFIIFLSTLVRSAFGFGNALVAMPLLALVVGVKEATPLVALAGLVIALTMLIKEWRELIWKDTLVLLISSLAGLPLGLLMLTAFPENIVRTILGVILIGFGLYNLLGIQLPVLKNPALAVPFGFLAGILGGAYNANGPPVVIYGMIRGWKKEAFRASLQGFFFVSSLMIITGHAIAGLWSGQILKEFLFSLPGVILAVFLGEMIAKKITQENFNRVIYTFLVLMGLLMFFR
ncbi:MAG: sulfite exporter TauE/SafE family protein [Anaerolineales bacterium]|nr:sulfite exporter TauE/SafE family protein [Anaerolineales bacterium]